MYKLFQQYLTRNTDMVWFVLCFVYIVKTSESNICTTPDKAIGKCLHYSECKPLIKWLNAVPKPLSLEDRKLLVSYRCGFDAKVCCPNNTNIASKPYKKTLLTSDKIPDVSQHRNIKLVPQDDCGFIQIFNRIMNGEESELFEFPWMALISYSSGNEKQFKCGGSIINDRYILTAAHCITNLKNMTIAGVRIGEYKISTSQDCETVAEDIQICSDPVQDIAVEEIIPHPKYNEKYLSNDIGLIRLAKRANFTTENVKPICLPLTPAINNPNLTLATVTGWGRTMTNYESDVLLKLDVPIISFQQCLDAYKNISIPITHRQICSKAENLKDSCSGDSGGPLQVIVNIEHESRYVQYGILSFGSIPCGQTNIPTVYTKVAHYLDWILDTIKP